RLNQMKVDDDDDDDGGKKGAREDLEKAKKGRRHAYELTQI
ncbi:hypothetical protein L195_g037508, partial [Trifolium pratense]